MNKIFYLLTIGFVFGSVAASAQESKEGVVPSKSALVAEPETFLLSIENADKALRSNVKVGLDEYELSLEERVRRPRLWSLPFFLLATGFGVTGAAIYDPTPDGCSVPGCGFNENVVALGSWAAGGTFLLSGIVWLAVDLFRHKQTKKRLRRVQENRAIFREVVQLSSSSQMSL